MAWDDKYPISKEENDKPKQPIYRGHYHGHYYCILRVGKSFKGLGQISQFAAHTERMKDTPNANPEIDNRIVIGGADVTDRVRDYIKDCKYVRPDTTLAREMLLTASPDFFCGMPESQRDMWVQRNIQFLEQTYGSNVIYATLHLDESTPHLHVLICPKIWSEARQCYKLSSYQLFGTKEKLRDLQTAYANFIGEKFPNLHRGIYNSKAKHIEIKHFYGIVKNVKSAENAEEIFKHDILLNAKLKGLNATLKAYNELLKDKENNLLNLTKLNMDLTRQVKELKKDNDMYKRAVKQLSQTYKLPQNAIEKVLSYVKNNDNQRTK